MEQTLPTLKALEESPTYGKYVIEPLERGYGVTLGNSLRRVMLSSIQGAAVTSVRIDGVLHEFSTIPGLREDATELLLNLKELFIRVEPQVAARAQKHVVRIDRKGAGRVTGADVECPAGLTVVNPECYIATIAEENAELRMEMTVEIGKGFVLPDKQETQVALPIGTIPVAAAFTPVRKVNYIVEPRRMGFKTDYEGLVLEVTTNGTIGPRAAVSQAARILDQFYQYFMSLAPDEALPVSGGQLPGGPTEDTPIEELGFQQRVQNSLTRMGIRTLGQLLRTSDAELLAIKNFGQKSLSEVHAKLESLGLQRVLPEEEAETADEESD